MIYPTQRFRLMVLAISVSGFFGFSAVGPSDRFAHAAEVKPAWQEEWEKVLAAAKKEGQVTVYISGYEEVLPEFEKEYPEIKLISVSGRGSQLAQRLITERRGEKYLADVFNSGGVTTLRPVAHGEGARSDQARFDSSRDHRHFEVVSEKTPL